MLQYTPIYILDPILSKVLNYVDMASDPMPPVIRYKTYLRESCNRHILNSLVYFWFGSPRLRGLSLVKRTADKREDEGEEEEEVETRQDKLSPIRICLCCAYTVAIYCYTLYSMYTKQPSS